MLISRHALVVLTVTAATVGALVAPAAGALAASPTVATARHGSGVDVRKLAPPTGRRTPTQFATDHLLVRFKTGATSSVKTAGVRAAGGIALRPSGSLGWATVATPDVSASLKALKANPSVAYAGYDYVRHATYAPDDPAMQFLNDEEHYIDTAGVSTAWTVTHGSAAQIIAVVDTGVDGTLPDLTGKVLPGEDYVDGDTNAAPAPVNPTCADPSATGHGTFVASVAAANTNNGIGIAGAGWLARVLPVRVLNACGVGLDSNIAAGITWAADHGATVINLSLGGPDVDPVLETALQHANSKGIPVVVAAGNEGTSTPQYPAAYPEAISVAATDTVGRLTYFTSFGDWVDVAAPGWNIIGEEPRALCATAANPRPTDCYYEGAGTSFAAPLVSGSVSLMRTLFPTWTPDQIKDRLERSAADRGPAGTDPGYGHGLLQAGSAVGTHFSYGLLPPAQPNHTPSGAMPVSLDAGGNGSFSTDADLEGTPSWYSFDTSLPSTSETITVSPSPAPDDPDGTFTPQYMDAVVSVYDSGHHHLLATGTPDTTTHVTTVTANVPSGTNLISVSNQNPSAELFQIQVKENGVGGTVVPGALNWVRDIAPGPDSAMQNVQLSTIPTSVQPTVTFDRPMDAATFTSSTVSLLDSATGAAVPCALTYDGPSKTLTISPNAALVNGTTYIIEINQGSPATPAQDTSGNAMPSLRSGFNVIEARPTALPLTGVSASGTPFGAHLSWDLPQTSDFSYVQVRYLQGTTPPTDSTGTIAYAGSLPGATVTGLTAGKDYAFTVIVWNSSPSENASATFVMRGSTTTVSASPTIPSYQAATVVTATVKTLDAQPSAGRTVSFYTRRTGSGLAYTLIGTGTTDANGQASITAHPTYNSDYEVVDGGGVGRMGSFGVVATPVRYIVSFNAVTTTVKAGSSLHFGGVVTPYRPGSTVTLQQYWGGVWHNMAVSTLNSTSRYGFTVTLAKRSLYEYRVVKAGDTVLSYGITPTITLTAT